jgi:hypothetical protein
VIGTALVLALATPTVLPPSILLEMRCRSDLSRSTITVFARGGVRLAEQTGGQPQERISVRELSQSELAAYLERLLQVDLREVPQAKAMGRGTDGEWLDQCSLVLQLPGETPQEYLWRRLETVPLGLSNLIRIVEEMPIGGIEITGTRLPSGYQPRPGDVLRRRDGVDFRVGQPTSDGRGIELQGVEQPFTIFVPLDSLDEEFIELVSSRHGRR